MNSQQMTGEVNKYKNSLQDNAFSESNTAWDQSAIIFAAVIDNADLLPDDGENEIEKRGSAYKNKCRKTPGSKNLEKVQPANYSLAELQEEHALWLK